MKNHLVFFSGGSASWYVAYRIKQEHGNENLTLLFTDTLIEDNDLYRFIIETSANIYDIPKSETQHLIDAALTLPEAFEGMGERKKCLESLRLATRVVIPNLHWLSEQRDVWDVFEKSRFLGNSRIAPCSAQLKQRMAANYVRPNFDPEDTTLYLGIDWTEEHRVKAPRKNWAPFRVEFPLVDDMAFNKIDIMKALDIEGIATPRLYAMGFAHNNCGGFCVRAGQGHFANLLDKNRDLYLYHEKREKEFIEWIGSDVAILKRTRKGVTSPLTLEQLRSELDAKKTEQIDFFDLGGCGCFVTDDDKGASV